MTGVWWVEKGGAFARTRANAHLIDDEAVAKMGHPAIVSRVPAIEAYYDTSNYPQMLKGSPCLGLQPRMKLLLRRLVTLFPNAKYWSR
jgi:hypothetical protein